MTLKTKYKKQREVSVSMGIPEFLEFFSHIHKGRTNIILLVSLQQMKGLLFKTRKERGFKVLKSSVASTNYIKTWLFPAAEGYRWPLISFLCSDISSNINDSVLWLILNTLPTHVYKVLSLASSLRKRNSRDKGFLADTVLTSTSPNKFENLQNTFPNYWNFSQNRLKANSTA